MLTEKKSIKTGKLLGYVYNNVVYAMGSINAYKAEKEKQDENFEENPVYEEILKAIENGEVEEDPTYMSRMQKKLLQDIQNLADEKQKQLKTYLAGRQVSQEQIERYQTKYELAKEAKNSGDYGAFNLEAELNGITAEELVDTIIKEGDAWKAEINRITLLIEAYRVKAKNVVLEKFNNSGQFALFNEFIEKAKELNLSVTEDEIKALFADFEEKLNA